MAADAYEANRVARVIRMVRWDRKGYGKYDGGDLEGDKTVIGPVGAKLSHPQKHPANTLNRD